MSLVANIQNRWALVSEKFSALQQREKILIAVCLLMSVYLVWELLFASAISEKRKALVQRFDAANVELKTLGAQEKVLVAAVKNDPNAAKRREVVALKKKLESADDKLRSLSVGLLSADELTQVLHDVLKETRKLELVGMESLAPLKLQLTEQKVTPDADTETDDAVALAEDRYQEEQARYADDERLAEERIIGVYKHAVKVTLKGDYFSVVSYLQKLEDLQWKLYWDSIDYQVDRYPNATVSFEVYTLSTERGDLGG